MNYITPQDIKTFVKLMKLGLAEGKKKELKRYSNINTLDGTGVPYGDSYVSLEFCFHIDSIKLLQMMEEDNLMGQVDDILKEI